jgi:phosphoribosylamine---glycine ligase
MNIAVIGSGGREHALVWKLRQSPTPGKLICIPGNPGMEKLAENIPVNLDNYDAIIDILKQYGIDLAVIGPEAPLVAGLADRIREAGVRCFGPGKEAALIEGSKAFSKNFMRRHNIPTAEFRIFTAEQQYDALRYLDELPMPVVIKASGLAAGKGVLICHERDEARDVVRAMLHGNAFKEAGSTIVIEEFLIGEEVSIFALCDGSRFVTLPPAQDHKRILDGDQGKNTGGMGAYAPAPVASDALIENVIETIIAPTVAGMREEGYPFVGCLYSGLILTDTGVKVLEYNCRFGDPESQVVLPLIDDDLAQILYECAGSELFRKAIRVHGASAVCVVMASGGYPDSYKTGMKISGLQNISEDEGVVVFHAGTKRVGDSIETAGGRVLGVTAIGYQNDFEETIRNAYRAVDKITFDGAYYRSDIGRKAVARRPL